ncbi:LytTR family DNA-binding domain-containing protein [Robinsoniella peoriensis]|uniref:LytTR family DNA-binding domain-containing protein n=1 Tax=Robinsoniella peoriensis TaxID=180332 RepID=UPI00085BEA16|nr:LytTR family DNA-binding domain-containing protein [Robinsoniella peoriensis]
MKVVIKRIPEDKTEYAALHVHEVTPQTELITSYIEHEEYNAVIVPCTANGKIYRIPSESIYLIESVGNVQYVHTKEKVFESSKKLYELEKMLPVKFVRINKSVILHLNKVMVYSPLANGLMKAELDNGKSAYISRKYLKGLRNLIREGLR